MLPDWQFVILIQANNKCSFKRKDLCPYKNSAKREVDDRSIVRGDHV